MGPAACSSLTSPTSNRIAPTPLSSSQWSKQIPPLLRFPAMAPIARKFYSLDSVLIHYLRRTSGKLIFSGDAGTNVAFPKEESQQAPRDQTVSIGDLLGGKPTYGAVFDEQRDGPRFG